MPPPAQQPRQTSKSATNSLPPTHPRLSLLRGESSRATESVYGAVGALAPGDARRSGAVSPDSDNTRAKVQQEQLTGRGHVGQETTDASSEGSEQRDGGRRGAFGIGEGEGEGADGGLLSDELSLLQLIDGPRRRRKAPKLDAHFTSSEDEEDEVDQLASDQADEDSSSTLSSLDPADVAFNANHAALDLEAAVENNNNNVPTTAARRPTRRGTARTYGDRTKAERVQAAARLEQASSGTKQRRERFGLPSDVEAAPDESSEHAPALRRSERVRNAGFGALTAEWQQRRVPHYLGCEDGEEGGEEADGTNGEEEEDEYYPPIAVKANKKGAKKKLVAPYEVRRQFNPLEMQPADVFSQENEPLPAQAEEVDVEPAPRKLRPRKASRGRKAKEDANLKLELRVPLQDKNKRDRGPFLGSVGDTAFVHTPKAIKKKDGTRVEGASGDESAPLGRAIEEAIAQARDPRLKRLNSIAPPPDVALRYAHPAGPRFGSQPPQPKQQQNERPQGRQQVPERDRRESAGRFQPLEFIPEEQLAEIEHRQERPQARMEEVVEGSGLGQEVEVGVRKKVPRKAPQFKRRHIPEPRVKACFQRIPNERRVPNMQPHARPARPRPPRRAGGMNDVDPDFAHNEQEQHYYGGPGEGGYGYEPDPWNPVTEQIDSADRPQGGGGSFLRLPSQPSASDAILGLPTPAPPSFRFQRNKASLSKPTRPELEMISGEEEGAPGPSTARRLSVTFANEDDHPTPSAIPNPLALPTASILKRRPPMPPPQQPDEVSQAQQLPQVLMKRVASQAATAPAPKLRRLSRAPGFKVPEERSRAVEVVEEEEDADVHESSHEYDGPGEVTVMATQEQGLVVQEEVDYAQDGYQPPMELEEARSPTPEAMPPPQQQEQQQEQEQVPSTRASAASDVQAAQESEMELEIALSPPPAWQQGQLLSDGSIEDADDEEDEDEEEDAVLIDIDDELDILSSSSIQVQPAGRGLRKGEQAPAAVVADDEAAVEVDDERAPQAVEQTTRLDQHIDPSPNQGSPQRRSAQSEDLFGPDEEGLEAALVELEPVQTGGGGGRVQVEMRSLRKETERPPLARLPLPVQVNNTKHAKDAVLAPRNKGAITKRGLHFFNPAKQAPAPVAAPAPPPAAPVPAAPAPAPAQAQAAPPARAPSPPPRPAPPAPRKEKRKEAAPVSVTLRAPSPLRARIRIQPEPAPPAVLPRAPPPPRRPPHTPLPIPREIKPPTDPEAILALPCSATPPERKAWRSAAAAAAVAEAESVVEELRVPDSGDVGGNWVGHRRRGATVNFRGINIQAYALGGASEWRS